VDAGVQLNLKGEEAEWEVPSARVRVRVRVRG